MASKQTDQPWTVRSGHEPGAHFGGYVQASDPSRPVYATTRLSFNPAGAKFVFEPGDRLEEILPADVLAACISNGEASYDAPERG